MGPLFIKDEYEHESLEAIIESILITTILIEEANFIFQVSLSLILSN